MQQPRLARVSIREAIRPASIDTQSLPWRLLLAAGQHEHDQSDNETQAAVDATWTKGARDGTDDWLKLLVDPSRDICIPQLSLEPARPPEGERQ
jgi:hypothetical protein